MKPTITSKKPNYLTAQELDVLAMELCGEYNAIACMVAGCPKCSGLDACKECGATSGSVSLRQCDTEPTLTVYCDTCKEWRG